MNATTTDADTPASDTDAHNRTRCDACNHDLQDHDSVSMRYCQATQAQALTRRCICPRNG